MQGIIPHTEAIVNRIGETSDTFLKE